MSNQRDEENITRASLAPAGRGTETPEEVAQELSGDGYIAYAEMREFQLKIGELLRHIVDAYLSSVGPQEPSEN